MKNILVALADCESATTESPIMAHTLELASAFSSKVWILHVVPRAAEPPSTVDRDMLRREVATEFRHEHQLLQGFAQYLRERNIDATALLVEGHVVGTILKESDRLNADLIVLGCHRHGLLFGALRDNTEEGLLTKCRKPILFVPNRAASD